MKNIFIKSMIVTVSIFVIGFLIGYYLDLSGLDDTKQRLTEIDNLWNDARLLESFMKEFATNDTEYCEFLFDENLKIAERIYEEGLEVEKYEESNRFVMSDFIREKRRYALLDLQFWVNTINLKERCGSDFSTVVYFYSQYNKTSEQKFQDKVLWDMKQRCGPKMIYITFPMDLEISTLDFVKKIYDIDKIPSILIDESVFLESPVSMTDLEKYLIC